MIHLKSTIDVELIQHCGGDDIVCHAARVSTRGSIDLSTPSAEEMRGLISYLMQHRHGTPFEHGSMTFRVSAPIFVWREWHRHRVGWGYNEESARYKTLDPVFYVPSLHRPMMKVDDWKPGRPKFLVDGAGHVRDQVMQTLRGVYEAAYAAYLRNLDAGVDPGLARDCLPVGIYSSCWCTCNPRSLMAFLSLRTHDPESTYVSYPLWEIELAARQLEAKLAELWPLTYAAFVKHGRVAP